ncbi:hypothetical protein FHX41_2571 [Actinomadura hallensis]|uniref:ARB-07466-like C-terminal domain-containing protein n=1 Tax=Actinomadura hallensis TaxID=337895 RepID=A0A543IE79_9ACTN|nr:hypothetical protein [Actinomadura hallensis]TQM68895.1 hypothetical protein FHX41_2571 [Actinomadura hallensis]HLV72098.1 hypothetical protein [Vulgatibacteraceae bacterium]
MGISRRGRALPAVIAAAAVLTLAGNVTVLVSGHLDEESPKSEDLVSVDQGAAAPAPAVAPLTRRHQPHLLVAGTSALPPRAVERAKKMKGVAGVAVVDAANAKVGERRMGLLGVDPSDFRAFAPEATAKSDQLWETIAAGGLAVSFEQSRDGALPLGAVVPAGSSERSGRVRVGAYASMGIGDVGAVVSREQARRLGLPEGNALVISAPKADTRELAARLKRILPEGVKVAELSPARQADRPSRREGRVRLPGRPDGATGATTPITGNRMTPTMRAVVLEIARLFGPFPVIGCYRSGADAQDHARGRACDFMQSTGGRMPSPGAMRHGDQVARYAVQNARRLGISYVIWRQHIWNVRGGGWRPMPDRGSLTQNHYDHVHISVLR